MSAHSLDCDLGNTLLEKKNAPMHTNEINTISGRMIRNRDMPADFIAVNSNFSPKFPNVIKEASSMARGNAIGTNVVMAYRKNSPRTDHAIPLPTSSVTCFHKNCINKMKIQIRNVIKNSVKKRLKI
jgi:hypothetical protein